MFKHLIYLILVGVGVFFLFKWYRKYKVPKINSLTMVTGGVKSGKSTFSVYLAISTHKRNVRKVKFMNFFRKMFNRKLQDIPLLYSNVPLGVNYVPLTLDLIMRKDRFVYGSVIYVQEASLLADSMLIKDKDMNNNLLLFNKLIGHETKGGSLIYDTQCIADVHYSIKRSISNYFYIHHLTKLPFFVVAHVRECIYSDDGSIVNNAVADVEKDLQKILIPKSVWKKFDCYCLSTFTDGLPVNNFVKKSTTNSDLKSRDIVSFRKDYNLHIDKVVQNEKKNEIKR